MGKAVVQKKGRSSKPDEKPVRASQTEAVASSESSKKPFKKNFKAKSNVIAKEVDPNKTKSALRRDAKSDLKAKRNPDAEKTKSYFKKYSDLINSTKDGRDPASLVDGILAELDMTTLSEFIVSHSGSRVIQACLKHGTDAQRTTIIEALRENIFSSVQANNYSLLAIEKVISYGMQADKKLVLAKLISPLVTERKKVAKLYPHRVGSKFLNYIFTHKDIPTLTKKALVTILTTSPHSDFHLTATADKLKAFYLETLRKTVDKELLALPLCHRMWRDILDQFAQDPTFLAEILGLVPSEALPSFLGTRDGVAAFVRLLGVAQAKEKKNVIKELKSRFPEISTNSVCCSALLRLLEVTDDTVLTGKSIFGEICGNFNEILFDQFGRLPFLFALEGCEMKTPRYYPEPYRTLFASSPVTSAMKVAEVKGKELQSKFLPALTAFVKSNFYDVSRDVNAKDVAIEVLRVADVMTINEAAASMVKKVTIGPHQVTVMLLSLRDGRIGNHMLKALVSSLNGKLSVELCTSRWAFILLEMAKKSASFRETLKGVVGLQEAATLEETLGGAKALVEYIHSDAVSGEQVEEVAMEEDDEEDGLVLMED